MKNITIIFLIFSLILIGLNSISQAQRVTKEEALTVANNWINLIIQKQGNWGGSNLATVDDTREFRRGDRSLGYFCQVKPKGYIVLSLYKTLAPIKAYSATRNLNPDSDADMADFLKGNMEMVLEVFNNQFDPEGGAKALELEETMETGYYQTWENLINNTYINDNDAGVAINTMTYQEGDTLLTTSWHQYPPFNDQCPDSACSRSDFGNYNTNAKVGCVATAAAQVMRYWSWPPYGRQPFKDVTFATDPYDWPNMANRYEYDPTSPTSFIDENNRPIKQAQIDAVAELCHEIGVADSMDYGCELSTGNTAYMAEVYQDYFRYAQGTVIYRQNVQFNEWYNAIKNEIDAHRPVQYRMVTRGGNNHSVVVDGYQIVSGIKQIHINYGHDDGDSQWYTFDDLDSWDRNDSDGNGLLDDQVIITNLRPSVFLDSTLASITYTRRAFPYRYFDRDAVGSASEFASGQYLQFLHHVTVSAAIGEGSYIYFVGETDTTRLFTRGDPSKGIRIDHGKIKLTNGGSITMH